MAKTSKSMAGRRIKYQQGRIKKAKKAYASQGYASQAGGYSQASVRQPILAQRYAPMLVQRKLPKVELKNFDTTLTIPVIDFTPAVAITGVLGQLDLIPQGVTIQTRVGQAITVKQIQIKGRFTFTPVAGVDTQQSRPTMWLILDKQCNGVQAATTDIWEYDTLPYTMLPNRENAKRFIVLKQWAATLGANYEVAAAATGHNCRHEIDYTLKCNIELDFSSTAGALTELKTNHLFLAYTDQFNDDTTKFDGMARLLFTDS